MKNALIDLVGLLLYVSGFLVWPICALLWRKKRRTTTLRWVFFGELACMLALGGLAFSSVVKLEHFYYWFILLILLNGLFTLLAFGAAICDYTRSE